MAGVDLKDKSHLMRHLPQIGSCRILKGREGPVLAGLLSSGFCKHGGFKRIQGFKIPMLIHLIISIPELRVLLFIRD